MPATAVSPMDLQLSWRETAVRQGLLCLVCSQAPSLEHRDAFYDTGVCESCSRDMISREAALPAP